MRTLSRLFTILTIGILTGSVSVAQTVRVTTWDMAATLKVEKSPGAAIEKTATQLKALSPDVVLLYGVTGWKMCTQLAEALKPADYRVVSCSSVRDPANPEAPRNQVAIMARSTAYFSWSEPWKYGSQPPSSAGFTFAAVQVAGHRFGFSCLELPHDLKNQNSQAVTQWLETLDSYRTWANNRLEGFVAAGLGVNTEDGEMLRLLRSAGFTEPIIPKPAALTPGQVIEGHLVPSTESPGGLFLSRWPVTCQFDFHPAPIIVVASDPAPPSSPASVMKSSAGWWWLGGGLGLLLIVIVFAQWGTHRKLARLQAQSALIVAGARVGPALSYNVVVSAPLNATSASALGPGPDALAPQHPPPDHEAMMRQGLLSHLTQWLKQAFVQRLVKDREKLLATQHTANRKVLDVDERLARLEMKIQSETSSYEKQIEQLSRELLTAREENLELIRAQINLLKSEMEETRARVLESEGL